MLNHLKSEANIAYTENGAVTNASTMSDCLDLFAGIGALRAADDQEIIRRFGPRICGGRGYCHEDSVLRTRCSRWPW